MPPPAPARPSGANPSPAREMRGRRDVRGGAR